MLNKAFEGCYSQADISRRVIEIENECSPEELMLLMANPNDIPEMALPFIRRNFNWMMSGHNSIRSYKRIQISENINFFQGPAVQAKSLLLCFCGNANRLMLPTPTFLQHIPEGVFDVLVVRDPLCNRYLAGVPGYADQFGGALLQLQKDISMSQYRDIRCLGTSAGGAAALYSSIFLEGKRALSVGGIHPSICEDIDEFNGRGISGTEFDDLIAPYLGISGKVELLAFFGDQVERDLRVRRH